MVRSGLRRKKLNYQNQTPQQTFSTPASDPVASVSEQKREQMAVRERAQLQESIAAYSQCCETARGKVDRIRVAIQAAGLDHTKFSVHALKTYLKTVDGAYDEYNEYQNKIYLADPSQKAEFEPKFVSFEELYEFVRIGVCQMIEEYDDAKTAIQLAVRQAAVPVPLSQPSGSGIDSALRFAPTIVLQQSALPSFDGKYENWFKFRQMFRDIADKCVADSAATKLHYLDKALVGKAHGAIDPQIIRDNDYEGAWRSLTEQFENLPALINDTISRLLNLKAMTSESFQQLKGLIDDVEKCVSSLEFHDLKLDKLSEAIGINLISSKLDVDTRKVWESNVKRGQLPSYKQLNSVLRNQQHVLERCENAKPSQRPRVTQPVSRTAQATASKAHASVIQKANDSCPLCEEKHAVEKCDAFKRSDVKGRYEKAKQLGLCFSCLKKGHRTSDCASKVKCSKCSKRHNVLLHPEEKSTPEKPESPVAVVKADENPKETAPTTVAKCAVPPRAAEPSQVLLATAVVYVFGSNGEQHECRVLLDSGAMTNFVSQRMVDLLQLNKRYVNVPIIGVNGMHTSVKFQVHLKVKSRISEDEFALNYLVVPRVTGALPVKEVHIDEWPIPAGINLADPTFFEPSRIDLLVGAEAFFDILLAGKIKLSTELPVLQESVLGWLVSGRVAGSEAVTTVRACQATTAPGVDAELVSIMKQFWSIDDQTTKPKRGDDNCERHFLETFKRTADGRFVVRLPFRQEEGKLGASRPQAEKRFYQLERRLDQNPERKKQYAEFIQQYIDLGHCRVLKDDETDKVDAYYLPHHCVYRPESSTTKLRVVFDASSQSSSGRSLNDLMMIGPSVQDTLFEILLRFRLPRYAFTADVPKMYRQVRMNDEDTKYQRILWRDDRSKPLQEIELTTVTYGTAAAPFLATRALNQLAVDEQENHPKASRVVSKSVYVDDVLSGANTLEEAKELQSDLVAMLAKGGFSLHKWCANDASLLEGIPADKQEKQIDFQAHGTSDAVKTLGLLWNPVEDQLFFSVKQLDKDHEHWTKQQVLSEIAKIFDPLGLLGPTIVLAKILMQELWKSGIGWNDELPPELMTEWRKLRNEFPEIANIKVPRRVTTNEAVTYEIHGFADASSKAYGCCIYLRSVQQNGTAEMTLLCAKSRVTPIKESERKPKDDKDPADMTMPRLELCAAKLLSEQAVKVREALDITVDRVVLWSDSQIVLSWLQFMKPGTPIFVTNRVTQIRELTDKFEWRYVRTKSNPADQISRGVHPRLLKHSDLWWRGPSFLRTADIGPMVMLSQTMVPDGDQVMATILKCSDFRKLERIFGYVTRFIANCKVKVDQRRSGKLDKMDFSAAVQLMVKAVQREKFREEIKCIETGKIVKGKLLKLQPVLDKESGLLRVGGRLQNSDLPYNQRHPMILPDHHLTELIIETMHREHLHVGQKGLLAALRSSFWPINGRRAIHRVLRRCVRCFRVKPKDTEQSMGNLPKCRVTVAEPFEKTGVDYAGPIFLKQGRSKAPVKAYIAIFVCLCTKAIHLELVTTMATDTFMAALHRFVGRRGIVSEMMSDNGTNFVGAQRELGELREMLQSQMLDNKMGEFCQARGITWTFNPPKAPHQGGLWEAGVKSAKYHLHRVLGQSYLTYEEMNTLLIQIEAVLNSRPLCQQSDDPLDYQALTPGHFLVGRELTAIPEPSYEALKENRLSRYQLVQKRKQDFFRRWCNEYLTELQQRGKWNKEASVVRKGMLVMLKQDSASPLQWKLGRIVDTHPGSDGVVRVVTVRTSSGEYRRPTTQIAILPILDNETQKQE